MSDNVRLLRSELDLLYPAIYVFSLCVAIYARSTVQSLRMLYDFYSIPPDKLYYISPALAAKLRRRLAVDSEPSSHPQAALLNEVLSAEERRRLRASSGGGGGGMAGGGTGSRFPYILAISLTLSVAGLIECLTAVIVLTYLLGGCHTRRILTGVTFQMNAVGIDLILATKAYLVCRPTLSRLIARRGCLRFLVNMWTLSAIGLLLLVIKHGTYIAVLASGTETFFSLTPGCEGARYDATLLFMAVGFDAGASLFFGTVFLAALGTHVYRVHRSTRSHGALTAYLSLLQSDLLQLILSTGATIIVLVIAAGTRESSIRFYPIALAHAITSLFMVESLRQNMRNRHEAIRITSSQRSVMLHL